MGSRHQEPPHTHVQGAFGLSCHRGVLPGAKKKKNWTVASGPKSSFQMKSKFVFNLETKVLESGGRVEKLIVQVT